METLELAKILRENELLMGQLYAECQKLFPVHAKEFRNLELEEDGHAFLLEEIIQDIKEAPENWKPGRMTVSTAKLFKKQLEDTIAEIRDGAVSPKYAITFAVSTELSLSEKDYSRALINDEQRFKVALQTLANGFAEHYQRLKALEKEILNTGNSKLDKLNRI